MATSTTTYLTNPTVTLNPATGGSIVDLTTLCSSATLTVGYDSLESTSFGDAGHVFVKGLQAVEVTLTLYAAYGASSVEATLFAAVGSGTSVLVLSPAGATESASNPEYTITNAMLSSFTRREHLTSSKSLYSHSFSILTCCNRACRTPCY